MSVSKKCVEGMLERLGIPFNYREFTEEAAVPPPFALWYFDSSNNFSADDRVYCKIYELDIELYTREKDFELEAKLEDILTESGLYWDKEEQWIESEDLYEVLYYMEVVYAGEQKE